MSWHQPYTGFRQKPERGILRSALKNPLTYQRLRQHERVEEKKEEELLVFGYACKLFPPDEHSQMIARNHHLIPWNGDENLQLTIDRYADLNFGHQQVEIPLGPMVVVGSWHLKQSQTGKLDFCKKLSANDKYKERYDARASLHDLSEFAGDSWNTHYEISEEETRIEQLCDRERYLAMYADIAEENTRHEEELKRLHASISGTPGDTSFKEVGFNYDTAPAPANVAQRPVIPNRATIAATKTIEPKVDEHEEKPFMAPSALAIPADMEIPPTEKMHAIIEKTANFVSGQGAQMEIVLKAKQAKNTQFMFLQFDHYLNPYYKHMVKRIKEGKYRPGMKREEEEDSDSSSDGEGGYLHPSLFASNMKKKDKEEDKEKYKAIQKVDPDHPLAKLIERGKKANALKQYNMMKSAVQNFKADSENDVEPPPLPPFSNIGSINAAAPTSPADQKQTNHTSTESDTPIRIVPPPPDIQPMVDSIARQIAEEGDDAEDSMRARNDPMLAFLLPTHELHAYYTFRKTFIREKLRTQEQLRKAQEEADLIAKRVQEKKVELENEQEDETKPEKSAPICFSIKTKKEGSVKTSLLLPNRLQILGDDSGEEEQQEGEKSESSDQEKATDDAREMEMEEKTAVKQKFVEESVTLNTQCDDVPEASTPELKKKPAAVAQKKLVAITTPSPLSNFTVVTPTGAAASIAVFREKQAERRQKATLFLKMKNKDSPEESKDSSESTQLSAAATEDIFQIDDDEPSQPEPLESSQQDKKESEKIVASEAASKLIVTAESGEVASAVSSPIQRKSSPAVTTVSAALTLKDLIAAASSRSSTPSSPASKKDRKRRRSRSNSRSRQSTPSGRKRRSRSRDVDVLPSSYRKLTAYSREREHDHDSITTSSHQRGRADENESVPSAYKIENPEPPVYRNGSRRSTRNRDASPSRESSRHRMHKHHRQDVDTDREKAKKRHRSHKSPSHKSKKKHHKHSKSKKKHKKNEKKKSKTKKKKTEAVSEEGEWSSSDEEKSSEEEKKEQVKKAESENEEDSEESTPPEDGTSGTHDDGEDD